MKEKKFIKKVSIICICLIVALTILLFLINFLRVNYQKEIEQEREKKEAEVQRSLEYKGEKLPDDVATPSKSYYFFSIYKGDISTIKAYKQFYELANTTIPLYYKNLKQCDQKGINTYFNNNKEEICKQTGIENMEEFNIFIKKIVKLKGEIIEFESFEFNDKTVIANNKNASADLIIKYSENNTLTINLTLLENENGKSIIRVNK